MTPDELRTAYLEFFAAREHRVVPSSPVIPEGDPTLLFTNAGMNQFKDVLLGREKRDYVRAASVQKCIRAGGKHNDLDEVGKDGRHLTFFEMLGNWSFGDYFKEMSIVWAWEFVTDVIDLSPDRLYVSVYKDDDEAWDIWSKVVGISSSRLTRLGDIEAGDDENFWSMGPTGPCGPSSEIYYDNHPEEGEVPWAPGFDEERFVELWNLVFMQYNRDESGEMTPLPIQSVDTGMGLDRVAAVLANVDNVFQSGLFDAILQRIESLREPNQNRQRGVEELFESDDFVKFCVIADHIRTLTFSVCDGGTFSNEGRGYVLRRILRRAVRYGRQLGFDAPFLCDVLDAVRESFSSIYPELRIKGEEASTIIRNEEVRFFRTLDRGIALFEDVADTVSEDGGKQIPGDVVFKLYDTFGFPADLTEIMAEERGMSADIDGYNTAMEVQRERSRAADSRYVETGEWVILQEGAADQFIGYNVTSAETQILRYRESDQEGEQTIEVCLAQTPFYAESGGQVGDTGTIETLDGSVILSVIDTQKTPAGITHIARLDGGTLDSTALRGAVVAEVDAGRRALIRANHTATHLLHAALHNVVSDKAFQAGSLVDPNRLRFDFSYESPVRDEQLREIERQVNENIRANLPLRTHEDVPLEDAEEMGAMMMFGEKYGEHVRVIEIPGRSKELCGGIHVDQTGDIAYFRVISETGVAAGVRRIEAITNLRAFERAEQERHILKNLSQTLKSTPGSLEDRVQRLLDDQRELQRKLESLQAQRAGAASLDLLSAAENRDGLLVIAARVDVANRKGLLSMADELRDKSNEPLVALLIAVLDDKPALLVVANEGATADFKIHAGNLVKSASAAVGGRGGGRPDMAQGGGDDIHAIEQAIDAFRSALP